MASGFPLWAAIRTVKSKIGTWQGFERYTSLDPSVTRETWARAIGEARAAIANTLNEAVRPLNRRPGPGEFTQYTSRTKTGYLQYVKMYVRDRETGIVNEAWWTFKTDDLKSRQSVLNKAWQSFETATLPEGTFEGEQIIGAEYAGTVQMVPEAL